MDTHFAPSQSQNLLVPSMFTPSPRGSPCSGYDAIPHLDRSASCTRWDRLHPAAGFARLDLFHYRFGDVGDQRRETSMWYISFRCPSISRVVIPREYIEMILSSKPVNRVCLWTRSSAQSSRCGPAAFPVRSRRSLLSNSSWWFRSRIAALANNVFCFL